MLSEQFNKPVDGSANYESPSGTHDKKKYNILSIIFYYHFFQFFQEGWVDSFPEFYTDPNVLTDSIEQIRGRSIFGFALA